MDNFNFDYWSLRLTFINNESLRVLKRSEEKSRRPMIDPADMARVRRVLFGPVDPEESSRYIDEQVKRLDVIQKERWNFDFKKEEPVSNETGSYKWSKDSPKKRILAAPKPRRLGQQKLTDYLPAKKSGESSQKKLKLIVDAVKDAQEQPMKACK